MDKETISEIHVITNDYGHQFEDNVNRSLKNGWKILSSSCAAWVGEKTETPRFIYTAILYRETFK